MLSGDELAISDGMEIPPSIIGTCRWTFGWNSGYPFQLGRLRDLKLTLLTLTAGSLVLHLWSIFCSYLGPIHDSILPGAILSYYIAIIMQDLSKLNGIPVD